MTRLLNPQPPPRLTEGDIWRDVIRSVWCSRGLRADMRLRRRQGIRRYGNALQLGNLRDAKADAYQEALDGIAYAEARRQELGGSVVWWGIRGGFILLAEAIRRAA